MSQRTRYNNVTAMVDDITELYQRMGVVEGSGSGVQIIPAPPPAPAPTPPSAPGTFLSGVDISDCQYAGHVLPSAPSGGGATTATINADTAEYIIPNNDHTLTINAGKTVTILTIPVNTRRVWVKGPGTIGSIRTAVPFGGTGDYIQDFVFDSLTFAPTIQLPNEVYAYRVAFVNCVSQGTGYFCWAGVHGGQAYSDYLFYGCTATVVDGGEAITRIMGANRTYFKNCTFYTGGRHCIRLHGTIVNSGIRGCTFRDYTGMHGNGLNAGTLSDPANLTNLYMNDVNSYVTGPEDMAPNKDGSVHNLVAVNCFSHLAQPTWSAWESNVNSGYANFHFTNCGRQNS